MSLTTDPEDPRLGHGADDGPRPIGTMANAALRQVSRDRIRIMRECSVEGCRNRHNSHGYCQAHGIRFRKYGNPLSSFQRPARNPLCSVEGCTKPNERKGLCQMHHWRLQVHGDVTYVPFSAPQRGREGRPPGCAVSGCERKHKGSGYCQLHLNRWRRGIPLDLPPKEPRRHRYRSVKRPDHPLAMKNGKVLVHRMVLFDTTGGARMPCFWCGRPVEWFKHRFDPSALHVDHLDHDPHNNDPTNLLPSCNSCNAGRIKGFSAKRVPVYSAGMPDGSEAGNRVGT